MSLQRSERSPGGAQQTEAKRRSREIKEDGAAFLSLQPLHVLGDLLQQSLLPQLNFLSLGFTLTRCVLPPTRPPGSIARPPSLSTWSARSIEQGVAQINEVTNPPTKGGGWVRDVLVGEVWVWELFRWWEAL